MDLAEGSETSANIKQTLGKHPKVNTVKVIFEFYDAFLYGSDNWTLTASDGMGQMAQHVMFMMIFE
jgi:hypothetical protein